MQIFNVFSKIALKKFSGTIMYIVIYTIVAVMVSNAAQSESELDFTESKPKIYICDNDNSMISRGLSEYMFSKCEKKEIPDGENAVSESLYFRTVDYVLTIPEGFGESFVNGGELVLENIKIPGSKSGKFTDMYVDRYLSLLKTNLSGQKNVEKAVSDTMKNLSDTTEVSVISKDDKNTNVNIMVYLFQFIPFIFIMVTVCGLAPVVMTFNRSEVKNRTRCSSLKNTSRNIQLTAGVIVYGLFVWLIMLIIAICMYGNKIFTTTGVLFVLNSLVFMMVAVGISLVVSNFELKSGALNGIANVVGLGMSFMCGVFVPQYLMSEGMLNVAKFLPAYWYVRASNMLGGVSGEVYDAGKFAMYIGIQLMFAVALIAINFVISKRKKV